MAVDDFKNSHDREDPITAATAGDISSADAVLADVSRVIYIGGSGDLKVDMLGGQTVTFTAMPVGWHPIRVTKIYKTGTTATNIVVGW